MRQHASVGNVGPLIVKTALALFVVGLPSKVPASTAPAPDYTNARISSSMQGVQRFYASRSPEELQVAIGTLSSAVDMQGVRPQEYVNHRRILLQAWSQVFKAIDTFYDPNFDPNNPENIPQTCLVPPRESSGRQLASCADPRDVQDLTARAAYVEALQANAQKTKRWNFQGALRYLIRDAMVSLQMQLDLFRKAKTPEDSAQLDVILRQAGLSTATLKKIEPLIYP